MLVYGECECFVMQMLYVCVLCAFCGSSQCSYEGLIKCKVLPPRGLRIPLLPCYINDKLMFVLCRVCTETINCGVCGHTRSERRIAGTWVSVAESNGHRVRHRSNLRSVEL